MKAKKELNALKEEVETVNRKLHELTDEELEQVSGGRLLTLYDARCKNCGYAVNGASFNQFTEESAYNKKGQYDKAGCPNCGMINMMEVYTIDW